MPRASADRMSLPLQLAGCLLCLLASNSIQCANSQDMLSQSKHLQPENENWTRGSKGSYKSCLPLSCKKLYM